eukprot:CAMPEP_0194265376 /NCGR_PEP_ID=MMETSP0169-20130528/640_1 /TAXON_ID=218684 /ORGANISM="Corethron pennatum, Strain L29A3" /LENGTH=536 /DNA_ID=CAMNT_0039005827 /DNA_START=74 /DNA_END=1684 /DNA_ORIENTATION=-
MKQRFILLAVLWHAATDAAPSSSLRGPPVGDSPCNAVPTESACLATRDGYAMECRWCDFPAIGEECVSAAQAAMLPPGVATCSGPAPRSFSFADAARGARSVAVRETAHGRSDLCDAGSTSYSGYMDLTGSEYDRNGEDKHLFYWMFEKRGAGDGDTPLIVWLTGGPGCSSTMAMLTENGPCTVDPDGTSTSTNPYSWTETAHVLWLDQPAGVGYSYGAETDANEEMVGEDAYYFLQAFFQTHPEYAGNPLYIVGESYGGHYAPAIAHRVWRGNKEKKEGTVPLALAGLSVGNGLTDPEHQYPAYPEMGYNNSHGIRVFSKLVYETMTAIVPKCVAMIQKCNSGDSYVDGFACQAAFASCNLGLTSPYQATGLNPYDIRIRCEKPPLCYDFDSVSTFLNAASTKRALGVDEEKVHAWNACNFGINAQFRTDWMKSFAPFVADLLDDGIPALMYAGDVDYICNYLGNRAWTKSLEWKGRDDFNAAEEHDWQGIGRARTDSTGTFTFLQVYDAGHMVPKDQPKNALDMISNFVNGGKF